MSTNETDTKEPIAHTRLKDPETGQFLQKDYTPPAVVETEERDLLPIDKKIERLKSRIWDLVNDAVDVVGCAINNKNFRQTGKKITRTQLLAAAPIVNRFAPDLENASTGAVHLHLNVPRPDLTKPQVIEAVPKDTPTTKIPGKFKR